MCICINVRLISLKIRGAFKIEMVGEVHLVFCRIYNTTAWHELGGRRSRVYGILMTNEATFFYLNNN